VTPVTFPDAPHQAAPALQTNYWQRAPIGIGKPRPALSRLRVKTPKRTIVPLSVDEVARFWSSFRSSRDLAIVGLVLLQGLRSQEVLDLNRDDLLLSEAQIRVRAKATRPVSCRSPQKRTNYWTTTCGWSAHRPRPTLCLFLSKDPHAAAG